MEGGFTQGSDAPPGRQLRPLSVGEVLDAAIKLYTRNLVTMWKIVAVVIIPVAIIQQLVIGLSLPSDAFVLNGTLYTFSGSLGTPAAGIIAELVLAFLAVLVVNGALSLAMVDAYVDQPLNWRQSLSAAVSRLGALIPLTIVLIVVLVIAYVLVIIPGIWLSVAFCVAVPAVMFEKASALEAMRRSWGLVRKRWWATFGALLVAIIMLVVVELVIGLVFSGIQSGLKVGSVGLWLTIRGLSTVVVDLIAYPFIAAVVSVIYIDLRVRKEALDLELLAGGFGPPVPVAAS
jgi:hypothetical protein